MKAKHGPLAPIVIAAIGRQQPPPVIARPIFRSSPLREVGIPVVRAKRAFAAEMPSARFHEKLRPGIPVRRRATMHLR